MSTITVMIGDERFEAPFQDESAPNTCARFRTLLRWSERIIHVRWSRDGCWIPLGDLEFGVGSENATSHP